MNDFPRTADEIAADFAARRAGLLKALTDEVEDFYQACDPEKENLCLYGNRNGSWSVELPAEEVPPELPEPCLGVNFARDGMDRKDWLALVAVHSDAWLMGVAYFYAVKLDGSGRAKLFTLLNQHSTLFEEVTGMSSHQNGTKAAAAAVGSTGAGAAATAAPAPVGTSAGAKRNDAALPMPVGYTGQATATGAKMPSRNTRLLTHAEISPALVGAMAELFWPDDGLWYPVRIESLDPASRTAKIVYLPGLEEEDLNVDDIICDGHMALQQ